MQTGLATGSNQSINTNNGAPLLPSMECFMASDSVRVVHNIWIGGHPLDYAFPLLCMQLFLVVFVTAGVHLILKPLKQPRIVAEILGGILLGPSFFGQSRFFKEKFFPDRGKPVLDTLSSFGLTFVIFLIGVKMDAGLPKRSGTKSFVIGLFGLLTPLFISIWYLQHSTEHGLPNQLISQISLSSSLSITSFAVTVPILSDLNLLNSELGQIAMSASMLNDGYGTIFLISFIVAQAGQISSVKSMWAFCSLVLLVWFILCVVRPLALWAISNTPPGQPVSEGYIIMFLFIVLLVGFYGDVIGTNSFHGALMLGLAIPDGPPLGATLVEKADGIVSGVMLPFYYIMLGLNTDVTTITDWHGMVTLIFLAVLGKLIGILLPSLYYGIPIRDALSLSLFMNSKGIVEVITYNLWRTSNLIEEQTFSILMLSAVTVTAVVTPIATVLYEPSRRYTVYKRRTIEHLKPGAELRIVACLHDEARVPSIINLLEAVQGTSSPLAIYALHLVELIGRAAPVFIPHNSPAIDHALPNESDQIANAFLSFQKRHRNHVIVQPFTTISPYASMHDEICRLAVEKKASFIVVPFHKSFTVDGMVEISGGLRIVNRKVLASAPCSVGVLVEKAAGVRKRTAEFAHDVVVFFFGGADDREALALGELMVAHPGVGLTVVRFLPSRSIRDDQAERRLDSRAVEEFRAANRRNERVAYREALVRDMEEIVGVIMEESSYDLIIVGLRHVSNSVVSEQLGEWSECPELGVIGDVLASSEDFEARFSVLVVKQQDEMGLHPTPSYHVQHQNAMEADNNNPRRQGGLAGESGHICLR